MAWADVSLLVFIEIVVQTIPRRRCSVEGMISSGRHNRKAGHEGRLF